MRSKINHQNPTRSSSPPTGPWIQTFTGRRFPIWDPQPEDVDPWDIIHALARLCRFTGHATTSYSVAQHSVLAAEQFEPGPVALQLRALLHDAHEAYVGDLSRPIKSCLPRYQTACRLIQRAVLRRFGLAEQDEAADAEIKHVDNRLCLTEARDLMGVTDLGSWRETLAGARPYQWPISAWGPTVAERMFGRRVEKLTVRLQEGKV